MALKVLLLRKDRERYAKQLEELRAKEADLEKREAELEAAIEELTDEATQEERAVIDESIEELTKERAENKEAIDDLDTKVRDIEEEISAEEEAQAGEPLPEEGAEPEPVPAEGEERTQKGERTEMVRAKFFRNKADHEVRAMMDREDVQTFLETVRSAIKDKRAISNVGLLVPEVFLGLIRENIMDYTKLYKHVDVRYISGSGRAAILGEIPEAVWTECCGKLNEMDLSVYGAEVECWKVGAYVAVCNATLEDSEIDLASEILTALSQGIGLALDKAILFGLGTRMPLGFFTRLAETSEPADYPADALPWVDLHETNIISIDASVTGIDLFREFALASAAAKGKYSRGEKVWVMNESTYTKLVASAMNVDAGGAIVAGVNGVMPVIGGIIEVLNFVPDDMIFGGYLDNYLLAERASITLNQSEHVQFLADNTVFKATARYDGMPVIPQAFVAIGLGGVTPSADDITFAPDTANQDVSE